MQLKFKSKKTAGIFMPAAFLSYILCFYFFDTGCIWRKLFHVICPGCGLTRAWISFLKFDFSLAFQYHAMFWSIPILLRYILKNGKPFGHKRANTLGLIFLAFGFAANYIFHLINGFPTV